MEHMPGSISRSLGSDSVAVGNVDVRDKDALKDLFCKYADENTTVWNLAAPLSVETAMDPAIAEAVTIGGMSNVIEAMGEVGAVVSASQIRSVPLGPLHRSAQLHVG